MLYSLRWYSPRKAIRLRLLFILVGSGVALGGTARQLWAAESVKKDQTLATPKELAIASDHTPESAVEVAREVLRLQQQLGGSIVLDRPQLQNLPTQEYRYHNDRLPHDTTLLTRPAARGLATDRSPAQSRRTQDLSPQTKPQTKVAQLRETAWLLDTQAHHLEELDLYEQADRLRDVATRLRHDARRLRRATKSTFPARRITNDRIHEP